MRPLNIIKQYRSCCGRRKSPAAAGRPRDARSSVQWRHGSESHSLAPHLGQVRRAGGTTLCGNQGQAEIAAAGGAGRKSAKNADRPMHQSREAHHSAWPHHSPEGGHCQWALTGHLMDAKVDAGLVDFPARLAGGRQYLLCWVLSEPAVEWWHWPDAGFAGRRPCLTR
jgi:Uncharacterized conserved protein (DUF2203)